MRSLTRPQPDHNYNPDKEIADLVDYRDKVRQNPAENRHIPPIGQAHRVLVATWNIANLGVHSRRQSDFEVIAAILSWFEIVAIQEVADNLIDFSAVVSLLPAHFRAVFNDRAGNDERSAFIYDTRRVELGPLIGEVGVVESDRRHVRLPGIQRKFHGFNRNPFIASFIVENTKLLFANCHLLYGKQETAQQRTESIERRQLEAYAISRWCDLRRNDSHTWTRDIVALGDFNLPEAKKGDPIYDALRSRGLRFPEHETRIPTNVSDTADYDQIAVTSGLVARTLDTGVFDFDGAIFSDIYDEHQPSYWRTCAKYYISDHRPLWYQFEL